MTYVQKFEISPHAEEFQIFPHNRCGDMWNFAKYGGISHIFRWQMWRNPKFTLFCCSKICFVANYAVFAKSVLARFTCFCVENNSAKNWLGGEKMTNIRYDQHFSSISAAAASAHQQHQRISSNSASAATLHQQHQRISSISILAASGRDICPYTSINSDHVSLYTLTPPDTTRHASDTTRHHQT